MIKNTMKSTAFASLMYDRKCILESTKLVMKRYKLTTVFTNAVVRKTNIGSENNEFSSEQVSLSASSNILAFSKHRRISLGSLPL